MLDKSQKDRLERHKTIVKLPAIGFSFEAEGRAESIDEDYRKALACLRVATTPTFFSDGEGI